MTFAEPLLLVALVSVPLALLGYLPKGSRRARRKGR